MLAFIRAIFSNASKIAPNVTARVAFRLFCTTFNVGKKSAQYQEILARAEEQFSRARHHTIRYSRGTISAFEFNPKAQTDSSQTVLLVHGWQSHSRFMYKFVEPLQRQGFRVITIDLPGHGQSSGRLFHLPLAVEAMHAVRGKLGSANIIISHSLGGAVVATSSAGTLQPYPAMNVSKLVLISSPDSMAKIFDDFATMVGLNILATDALRKNITRLSGLVAADFDVSTQLQQVQADILLLHAPDDKEVPYSESEKIAQANETAILEPVEGLGHRRIIASDDVVQRAVQFLSN